MVLCSQGQYSQRHILYFDGPMFPGPHIRRVLYFHCPMFSGSISPVLYVFRVIFSQGPILSGSYIFTALPVCSQCQYSQLSQCPILLGSYCIFSPMFPRSVFPGPLILTVLLYVFRAPYSQVPIFPWHFVPRANIPRALWSQAPIFPGHTVYSQRPMFPVSYIPQIYTVWHILGA